MKSNIKYIVFLLGVLFWGCRPLEKFPLEPRLEFVSLEKIENGTSIDDKAILILRFTDGDGNVGLDSSYTQPPFDTASIYKDNFFVLYYAKRNGEFISFPEFSFNARLPRFLSTNNPEPLEGEIEYVLNIRNPLIGMPRDSIWIPVPAIDTIMFECWIVDRDLNESNRVFTSSIQVVNRLE